MLLRTRLFALQPALALGVAILWGVIESVALWRSRRRERKVVVLHS